VPHLQYRVEGGDVNPYSKRFLKFLDGFDEEMQYRLKERHAIHVDSHCTPDQAEELTISQVKDQMPGEPTLFRL